MAELFVLINRKVSADKQKDQVPDGTPNCKGKYKTTYLLYVFLSFDPPALEQNPEPGSLEQAFSRKS